MTSSAEASTDSGRRVEDDAASVPVGDARAAVPASGEFHSAAPAGIGTGTSLRAGARTQIFDGPFSAPAPSITNEAALPEVAEISAEVPIFEPAGPPATASSAPVEAAPSSRALSASADRLLGVEIDDRYVLEEVLGEGGMGIVLRGRHKVIGKRVAVKVLRADLAGDAELTERFLTEAKAASSVGHPNIVEIFDYGKLADGSAYFVMEYLEGYSLAAILGETPVLPMKRVYHIGRQVAEALQAAHDAGVVHRDMKPENVMLIRREGQEDHVKILDFGIAKIATATNRLTRAGSVFGTPQYMSPEQANGDSVDHRTDIYALGCMLFEMAMGRVPFNADNVMAILSMQMFQAPPRMSDGPHPIPEAFENLIHRALAKRIDERYQSLREVADDLRALERGETPEISVPAFSSPRSAIALPEDDALAGPRRGSSTAVALGALAVLVLGGGAVAAFQLRPSTTPPPPVTATAETPAAPVQPLTVSVLPKVAKITVDGVDIPLKDGTAKVTVVAGNPGKLHVEALGYVPVDRTIAAADGPVLSFVLDKTPVDIGALPLDKRPVAAGSDAKGLGKVSVSAGAPSAVGALPTLPPPTATVPVPKQKPKGKDEDDPWK
jgi:serine/threonine-protein kinase